MDGPVGRKSLSSPCCPLCSAPGVNSFMVYMAYKDLYQMSNTEVRSALPPWLCQWRFGDGSHAGYRVAGGWQQ